MHAYTESSIHVSIYTYIYKCKHACIEFSMSGYINIHTWRLMPNWYKHTCLCTYIHSCIYIYTHLHTYRHSYLSANMYTYIFTWKHACIHTCILLHVCTCKPFCIGTTNMYACIHTYLCTYIHTYMDTYTSQIQRYSEIDSHVCVPICIDLAFLFAMYIVLELDISSIFGFAIFPDFQNFHTSGNMAISTFFIDKYPLLFSVWLSLL